MGDGLYRFSQTLDESIVMLRANSDRKIVFRISKYIVSILKAEPWYPQYIKERYQYFSYRFFNLLPFPGFLLKSAYFLELEQIPQDEQWTESWYLTRVKRIFMHMCRKNQNREDEMDKHRRNKLAKLEDNNSLDTGNVSSYFASNSEKQKSGYMAPAILKFLDELNIEDFV